MIKTPTFLVTNFRVQHKSKGGWWKQNSVLMPEFAGFYSVVEMMVILLGQFHFNIKVL